MRTIIRGIKNIFRNKFRNIAIILVLALALSLALMMININFSLNHVVGDIKEKLGTKFDVNVSNEYIESINDEEKGIHPKQEDYLFDEVIADEILIIDSVKSVDKKISGNFISKKYKSVEADFRYKKGDITTTPEGEEVDPTHWLPLIGIEDVDLIYGKNKDICYLIEGKPFKRTDIEQNVALIEEKFAKRNNLKVGSEMIINEERIRVCGIYKLFKLGSDTIYTPFKTAQRLLNFKDKVTVLTVTVDLIDNVQKTIDYINNKISDRKIEAHQDIGKYTPVLASINNIKKISKVSVISAFAVSILVILLIMVINVIERAKEIGILKAIGASNINISAQFLVESIALCTIALILSLLIILAVNQPIANCIVEREKTKSISESELLVEEVAGVDIIITPEKFESLKIAFSPQILIFAIMLTFLLGIVGSLIPAYYISKLRPAEVLRFG